MKLLTKAVTGAAIGIGVLAASAVTASAAVVCSGNVCWHTHERYEYPATAGVVVHEDDWKWGPSEKYTSANTKAEDIGAEIPGQPGSLKRPPTRRPLFI
jgi:hypothetical protein